MYFSYFSIFETLWDICLYVFVKVPTLLYTLNIKMSIYKANKMIKYPHVLTFKHFP
jgi:hypothetical protein